MLEVDGRDIAVNRVLAAPPWATLIVGEGPSKTSDPHQPLLGGRSGQMLAELVGLPPHQFGMLFRCVNLLPAYAGTRKRHLMRAAGPTLRVALDGRRAVFLGREVAAALGARDMPFMEWRDLGLLDAVVLPHPSGENRLWHDASLHQRVAGMLRAEAGRAAEGALMDLEEAGACLPWLRALVQSTR